MKGGLVYLEVILEDPQGAPVSFGQSGTKIVRSTRLQF